MRIVAVEIYLRIRLFDDNKNYEKQANEICEMTFAA